VEYHEQLVDKKQTGNYLEGWPGKAACPEETGTFPAERDHINMQ